MKRKIMKHLDFLKLPFKWFLIGMVCVVIYLVVIVFMPGFHVDAEPVPVKGTYASKETGPACRTDIEFIVEEMKVRGWLYFPENTDKPDPPKPVPCIIMNNGLGGTKDMLLEPYALRFVQAGFAVITYDYRYFGDSEGSPRQLYDVESQLFDCRGAIAYARNHPDIDHDRIAIWGTSAGGSYGLAIAAVDGHIACVVSQVAGYDHDRAGEIIAEREGLGFILKLLMHAQRDKGRSRFGLSAHTIPIVGKPGTLAMSAAPGAFEGYSRIVGPGFINELCARAILTSYWYNPVVFLRDVSCPVLIQAASRDNHCPVDSAREAVDTIGHRAEFKLYDSSHYGIYHGDIFEQCVVDQIAFLRKSLEGF